jgi:hypothetical protein
MEIIARLVDHGDILSDLILEKLGGMVAHAELFTEAGTVIGAYAEGGVQERPLDYDHGKFRTEILIALPTDADTVAKVDHFMRAPEVMHEPYDYLGLLDFTEHFDFHQQHKVFCSALLVDALRWTNYFPHPLPISAHKVYPVLLQQMLLCRPDAKIITRDDPIFKAHIAGT